MTVSDTNATRELIVDTFPEINQIEDADLRDKVISVWTTAIQDKDIDSLAEMAWGAYYDDIHNELQVDHIRQVTQHAVSMIDQAVKHRSDLKIDRELLLPLLFCTI